MPAAPGRRFTDTADWQPLRLLTFYRLVLSGLITVLYFALADTDPFSVEAPQMFRYTLFAYLGFSVVAGFSTRLHWPGHDFQALVQVLADIGAIALLMHATGGVSSALSVLLVIAVAVGSMVLPGRPAYLFAAVATLAVLFETGLTSLAGEETDAGNITRAGLMGAVLFIAAGLAHILVIRARESEALAAQRGIDLADLEQLNRYIIRQLESGLIVVDPRQRVRLANETARGWLSLDSRGEKQALASLAPELDKQLRQWRTMPDWQPHSIQTGDGTALLPRFSTLETSEGRGALILLEDSAQLARHTQQIKLASLGRLTASIAHEIRNPLGAISHAAQLLEESDGLDAGDRRLTEIIGNHTRRVNTIIENVLQLSRRSTSQPQHLQMRDWLENFKDELIQMEQLNPEQVSLDVHPDDLTLYTDPGHLHQVLTNLCQNGIRHGGTPATLKLRAAAGETGVIRLDVVDNGAGIDEATEQQIFEPFFTTASSGTGLGLYIARELCESNQARLGYLREPDGGSCFRISFAAQSSEDLKSTANP